LQSFIEKEASTSFGPALLLVSCNVGTGVYGKLVSRYCKEYKGNRCNHNIRVWADFDLYHRNDYGCAVSYANKPPQMPDFLFSFHNFEDFFALHHDGAQFESWLRFGGMVHFSSPLHEDGYLSEIQRIFPEYTKGNLPVDFISWSSLRNLKANLRHQPSFNPHGLQGVRSFAEFLIGEMERAFPGKLQ
jgi:hypothetical protein